LNQIGFVEKDQQMRNGQQMLVERSASHATSGATSVQAGFVVDSVVSIALGRGIAAVVLGNR